jgi:carboxyl-terminal processing protease
MFGLLRQALLVTLIEFVLAGYAAIGPLWLASWRRARPQAWRVFAIAGAVIVVAALAFARHRPEVVPLVVVAVVVAALAYRRARAAASGPAPRGLAKALLAHFAAGTVTLVVLLNAAFIEIFDPLANAPFHDLFSGPGTPDFSKLAWPAAFDQLHAHLTRAYAMGELKRVDWKALHDATAWRIEAAARTSDRAAYYLALREYLWALHDGHVDLSGDDGGAREAAIKGGFGFALIQLDGGQTIAHVLVPNGPAAAQGMQWGAVILQWNGADIDAALAQTPTTWASSPPATVEGVRLARLKLLPRARVGTRVTVAFRNSDDANARTVELVADEDHYEPIQQAGQSQDFSLRDTNIDWRVLDGNIGYLKIRGELPTLPQLLPDSTVRRAMNAFVAAGVKGVVVDVRGNIGGADKLVPLMMGYFVDRPVFYEHATLYSDATGRFEREPTGTLWTAPRDPRFRGPLAVLVDDRCVSSGEGFALVARQRAGSHVVGFYGTYGSFGMSGAEVIMPGGLTVGYPNGQSLDANGHIQIDSNWELAGGIAPDVRVPLTLENVRAHFKDGRDVVLETAVSLLK